jgi:hypothetical protein
MSAGLSVDDLLDVPANAGQGEGRGKPWQGAKGPSTGKAKSPSPIWLDDQAEDDYYNQPNNP